MSSGDFKIFVAGEHEDSPQRSDGEGWSERVWHVPDPNLASNVLLHMCSKSEQSRTSQMPNDLKGSKGCDEHTTLQLIPHTDRTNTSLHSKCIECILLHPSPAAAESPDSIESSLPNLSLQSVPPCGEVDLPLVLPLGNGGRLLVGESTSDSSGLLVSEVKGEVYER